MTDKIQLAVKSFFKGIQESRFPEASERIEEFLKRLSYEFHLVFDQNTYKITEKEITNIVQYHVREKLEKKVEEEFITRLVSDFNSQYRLGFKKGSEQK